MFCSTTSTVIVSSSMIFATEPTVINDIQDQQRSNFLIQQATLRWQGKMILENQLQQWQMRQEALKQVERDLASHRFMVQRNIKILEMKAMPASQKKTEDDESKDLQEHMEDSIWHLKPAEADSPMPFIVPSLDPFPFVVIPLCTNLVPMYHPVYMVATGSMPSTQEYCAYSRSELQPTPMDTGDMSHVPLPNDNQTSCAWKKGQQTASPIPHMRPESPLEELSQVPCDPALMCLNYLPFISENEISKQETEDSETDTSSISSDDSDDEDCLVVLLNNKL